ncbi:MAG TPA: FAD-binding oxidoreductase [Verrucomicrobiae bacterium]|nr:FAD-binding oxidoreductase [Verrucomicrobiae bacterium]
MQEEHQRKVAVIAEQIKQHYHTKTPFRVFHGSTNSTRTLSFKRNEVIDVSDFNTILSIKKDTCTAVVEPNIPMDTLVEATTRLGLLPPVVTEFPGITVGGGIQGGAGESSSFKWGFFSQTVNWIEYVLADGSVITASPTEHADLFYGASGSSGTLGVITALEVQLIPATKYVQLTYTPVASFEAAVSAMERAAKEDHDYIDGILFGKDHGVIITGKLSNDVAGKIHHFSHAYNNWYYLHAAGIDASATATTETVPLKEYLFRYDRGAFWVGRYAFERFGLPFNTVTRFILNPILHTRKLYQALQASGASQEYIIQDLTLPISTTVACMNFIDELTGIYPLWVCPIKPEPRSPLLCNGLHTPLAINIGVWGPQIPNYSKFKRLNTRIEAKVTELGGKKWLYAHTYYTEAEFWSIYSKSWYEKLRKKYHATALPTLYDKVRVRERQVVSNRRGLRSAIFGRTTLHIEK